MKVLRAKLHQKGPVTELTASLEDRSLAWCVWNQVPWVAPHKDLKVYEGWDWQATSPMAYFRSWFGTPMIENEEMPDDGVYNADVAVPGLTVDQIMLGLVKKQRRIFFAETNEMETLGVLLEIAEEAGKNLEIETHEKRWSVYPSYVKDWLVKTVDGKVYVHMGFTGGLATREGYDSYEAVEVRFWRSAGRIDRIDSADGSCILTPEDEQTMRVSGKQGWQPFGSVQLVTEEELGEFVYAFPVKHSVAEILIETPLAEMDEVFLPRVHLRDKLTVGQLSTYLERRLKVKAKSMVEVCEALATYAEGLEAQLMKSLGAPMMVLSGESGEDAKTWVSAPRQGQLVPKPSDLSEVRSTLSAIIEDGNDVTSDLLVNLVCRACVVMHLRNTTVFDPNYKTQMFTYAGLLEALLRAESGSKAGYTTPFLMIGSLDKKKRPFAERKTVTGGATASPLIGGSNAGW